MVRRPSACGKHEQLGRQMICAVQGTERPLAGNDVAQERARITPVGNGTLTMGSSDSKPVSAYDAPKRSAWNVVGKPQLPRPFVAVQERIAHPARARPQGGRPWGNEGASMLRECSHVPGDAREMQGQGRLEARVAPFKTPPCTLR